MSMMYIKKDGQLSPINSEQDAKKYVPNTRKINGKSLEYDVNITAEDINGLEDFVKGIDGIGGDGVPEVWVGTKAEFENDKTDILSVYKLINITDMNG